MIRRTKVDFAVRTDAAVAFEVLADSLTAALGFSFSEGEFRRLPAFVGDGLGVRVSLAPWRGIGDKDIFMLHGQVTERGFLRVPKDEPLEFDRIDISAYMVDLLNIRTPYRWYIPTQSDLDAENEHAIAIDRAMEEGPGSE